MMGRVCVTTEGEQGVFGLKGNVTSELETDLLRETWLMNAALF